MVDFGTGSGCILLAALSEFPNAIGLGTDRDAEAIAVAADNARRLGLAERARFSVGNWTEGIEGPFDVILANPPYVEDEALPDLAIEVIGYEPRLALSGGADGLDGYRAIIPEFPTASGALRYRHRRIRTPPGASNHGDGVGRWDDRCDQARSCWTRARGFVDDIGGELGRLVKKRLGKPFRTV